MWLRHLFQNRRRYVWTYHILQKCSVTALLLKLHKNFCQESLIWLQGVGTHEGHMAVVSSAILNLFKSNFLQAC